MRPCSGLGLLLLAFWLFGGVAGQDGIPEANAPTQVPTATTEKPTATTTRASSSSSQGTSERQPVLIDVSVGPPSDIANNTKDINQTSTVNDIINSANIPLNFTSNENKGNTQSTISTTVLTTVGTQSRGIFTTVAPRKEVGATHAVTDVTATSQSILFANTSKTVSSTSTGTSLHDVTSKTMLNSTTAPNVTIDLNHSSNYSKLSLNITNPESIELTTSSIENVTNSTVPSTTTSVSTPTVTDKSNLILTFNSTCEASISDQLQNVFGLYSSEIQNSSCQNSITISVSIQNSNETNRLQDLIGKAQLNIKDNNYTLVDVYDVSQSCPSDNEYVPNMFAGIFLSSREIVTYAIVGAIFGFAILLIIALLCCKCWCRRRRKTMDDIPHLTMRLEDYSLTRIPRPSTIYNDGRGYSNGVNRPSQSFDTSVVPIEEAPSTFGQRRDLQSFNSKRFRQRNLEREEDLYSRGGSVLAGSTERLARDSGSIRRGAENPTFRF